MNALERADMATRTNCPQPADFYEFASKRRELFADDISQAIATLRCHRIYRWLRKNPYYKTSEKKLAATPSFQAQLNPAFPEVWELLWFASLVSQCLGEYCQGQVNPRRRRVITKADLRKAHAGAATLRELIEHGLEVGEPGDTSILYELLEKIPQSLNEIVIAARKAGERVPVMTLTRVLGVLLQAHYRVAMPSIVHKVVQVVEPAISARVVRRYLSALK